MMFFLQGILKILNQVTHLMLMHKVGALTAQRV